MRRKLIDKLLAWKEETNGKALMLYGASGVGKTYLALDFAKSFYNQFIYFDLGKDNSVINNILESDRNELSLCLDRYQELTIKDGIPSDIDIETILSNNSNEVLLVFDNIQLFLLEEANELYRNNLRNESNLQKEIALKKDKLKEVFKLLNQSLKYHVLAISNELIDEFAPNNNITNEILHPIDFEEFLYATGHEWYIETIKIHYRTNNKLPDIVHKELLKLFDIYLEIGGMPHAVNEYNNTESLYNITNQHKHIMNSYLYEVNNKIDIDGLKINQVFASMDKQLLKENRKFQYNMIRKGATCSMYSNSIDYIQSTFYGLYCIKVEDSWMNNICGEQTDYIKSLYNSKDMNLQNIKLYYCDVGLLNTSMNKSESKLDLVPIKHKKDLTPLALCKLFDTNKRRGLIENYIATTLASNGYPLIYWESNSLAKIEFLIRKEGEIIPIEVRPNDITRSKNFSVFKNQYKNVNKQIKISTKNFEYNNHVKYVPIYAAFCI